jgi:inosine-uridine nucleoside N-ribohydrolase
MLALVASATLLVVPACGGDDDDGAAATTSTAIPVPTEAPSQAATPVIVDTDLATDDIVALTYLASRPDVDLLAVTVSGTGEVRCPRGADIARGLLAGMGRSDTPVACGSSQPLAGRRAFPEPWRDGADNAYGLLLEVVTPPADQMPAVDLLAEQITASAEPVVLLTLGPLTNVAEAFVAHPDMSANIARIVTMGGAVDVPGNVIPDGASEPNAVEWNLYVDPEAAADVVESGVPITLVALDATNQVPLDEELFERLEANNTTDATDRALRVLQVFPPPYLWDTLAAIAITDPALVPTRPATITVQTDGDEAGRTVADAAGTAVDVAEVPNTEAVIDRLLRTLAGVPEDQPLVTPTTLPILGSFVVGFADGECTFDGPSELRAGRYQVSSAVGEVEYYAVIAHFAGDATTQDALDWVAQHPDEEPPMVDEVAAIGEDGASSTDVVLTPGNAAVVCFTMDNAIHVATDLLIT